jgi:AcrR family transcriptional regulator
MSVQRLPRGRHSLSREEVVASQRERILRALADTMVEKGYVASTVADVIRAAGVSRETFYEQFDSKADCFMAAYEQAVTILLTGMGTAIASDGEPLERFDAALGRYLEALSGEPAFARLFLVEVYAAGPDALERRAAAQSRFVEVVAAGFGARTAEQRFAAETLVAATSSMVTARLAAGDVAGLRDLREPFVRIAKRLLG